VRVLLICHHDWAGAVHALMGAVNRHTDHDARAVAFESTWLDYPHDVLDPNWVDLWRLLNWADVLNLYDGVVPILPAEALDKPVVRSYLGSEYRANWQQFNRQDKERGWLQTCTTIDLSLHGPMWLPQPMGTIDRPERGNPFTVCHAPTNRNGKGTSLVMDGLGGLEGVQLHIIERQPHSRCMAMKANAHLLVDQVGPHALGYGRNALEAWALGMPVISDAPDEVRQALKGKAGGLPFYRASTAAQVRAAVEELRRPDVYAEWRDRGRRHLRKWHDPATVADCFVEACQAAYHPRTYWQQRGNDYEMVECPDELESLCGWFKSLEAERILEVGAGWGRIYSQWRGLKLSGSYTMCDFVGSMLDGCQRATGTRPDEWDGKRLPYPDDSFDLVVSFSVFLHVPPIDLKPMLAEHVRVCGRWLFVASLDGYDDRLSPHCFVHDYESTFAELGLEVADKRQFGDRAHWLLRKGDA
jgi:hypothetical protein